MPSIENRRSLSYWSLKSHSNGLGVRSVEGPGSPREALKKLFKTPFLKWIYQDSYTVHGLYRGQKVLEPQKFAVTLQWVGSEVNRGHLSPVGNVRGHLFPSQVWQSESQLPRLRLLIWVFGYRNHPYITSAKKVGGWRWLNADVSWLFWVQKKDKHQEN